MSRDDMLPNVRSRRNFLKVASVGALGSVAGCTGQGQDQDSTPTPASGDGGDGGTTPTATPSAAEGLPNPMVMAAASPFKPIYYFAAIPGLDTVMQEEYGIDVQLKAFNGFTAVVAGLFKGEAFIAHTSLPAVINAVNQGIDLVSPVGYVSQYIFPVVVRPEIGGWEDLQGKQMALHAPTSLSAMVGRTMAKEELGPDHDIRFKYIIGTPNRVAALVAGDVAAAAVSMSGAFSVEKQGIGRILGMPWDYEKLRDHSPNAWSVMSTNWEEHGEALGIVVKRLIDTYNRMYEVDPAEITQRAQESGVYGDFDSEVYQNAFEAIIEHDTFVKDGGLHTDQIQKTQDVMIENGIISKEDRIERSDFVVDKYLPY